MSAARYPSLYQLRTRVATSDAARELGRAATLDDISDRTLDGLAAQGLDWVWLLGVWCTGRASARIARADEGLRREIAAVVPDLATEDIQGSGFAITSYTVEPALGGDEALARLRARLAQRGLRLMLDFVPNHTALDHPWVDTRTDLYVRGCEDDIATAPGNYVRIAHAGADLVLAHGRDPNFAGWTDTLQLDYANAAVIEAMTAELVAIAARCDGVRCDMAMLLLPEVFERTWGRRAQPFWAAAIERVRLQWPRFCFLAEVYWDREWTMMQLGFDYAYDKRLYDRLRDRHAAPVRAHLRAGMEYQDRLARFLENHDEARAAATFGREQHAAAAIVTYLTPGLRFFHDGQIEGLTQRIPAQLVRRPAEAIDATLQAFYTTLLDLLRTPALRDGDWQPLECVPASEGNDTAEDVIAWQWRGSHDTYLVVAVNYSDHRSQCYVQGFGVPAGGDVVRFEDVMGDAIYDRLRGNLAREGLYLDVPAWAYHVFAVEVR